MTSISNVHESATPAQCSTPEKPQKMPGSTEPLGIYAKYSSRPEGRGLQTDPKIDPSTGEIISLEKTYCPVTTRLERFVLQSAAKKALRGSKVTRINNCLAVRHKGSEIKVHRSKNHLTCCYSGLQTCASVWVDPICAAKISERRRLELQNAIEQHLAQGGAVFMLTLTNPHYLCDKLSDVLEAQAKALKYFNNGKMVTRFNQSIGYIGSIRALEVTHGRKRTVNNGWHPHYHILIFVESVLDLGPLRLAFYLRWLKACEKAKMPALPDYEHGVRLEDGSKAAAYASKWGLESEMTKGHIKTAKNGETPFDLLRAYAYDDDKQAAALFREFGETFKGKRQLHWSSGLKSRFDLDETTDEELAAEQDDDAAILGTIEIEDWQLILKADVRGEILELARHGWEPVERFLSELKKQYEVKK
jgi:hypothetical protein